MPDAMTIAVETAYAKINLTLEVLGRRPDGMHELASIVTFAEMGDILELVERSRAEQHPAGLDVTGPFAEAIVGENLVERAVRLVEKASGQPIEANLTLDKRLPVASGIGGGSADAAAALRLLRRSFLTGHAPIDWDGIAQSLGADVPVCLASRPALMSGTGERLQHLELPPLDIVIANAREPVPADKTRQVFKALGAGPVTGGSRQVVEYGLTKDRLLALIRDIGNDLEPPAMRVLPGIAGVKATVSAAPGCEIAFLSGAGPTVVGVFATSAAAQRASDAISAAHPAWWVTSCRTLTA